MKIRIRAFASAKEALGFEEKDLIVSDEIRIADVISELVKGHSKLKEFSGSLLYAINNDYSTSDAVLSDNDVLAIFPPVNGG